MRRALRTVPIAAAAIALSAALLTSPGQGQDGGGGIVAQPVLGVADAQTVLLGAVTVDGAPGETWAYRVMPAEYAGAVLDGQTVPNGPLGDGLVGDPQLVLLRHTDATGWRVQETPLDREGRTSRGIVPNPRAAEVLPRGGGYLLGRAQGTAAPGDETRILVRNPGGRFGELPAPPDDVLLPAATPEVDDPGEALAGDRGLGNAVATGYEDGDTTHVLVAPRGRQEQSAVLHWDGETWSREPVEIPAGSENTFEIVAIDATGPGNAWFVARPAGALDRGIVLFERDARDEDAPVWRERPLDAARFADAATPALGISDVTTLDGGLQQTLTVTADGVWVDGSLTAGGATRDLTLFVDPDRDAPAARVLGSWCDAQTPDGEAICDRPLGVRFSRRTGYRSLGFAAGDGGFGGRIVSNPLRPGGEDDTNLGTYLSLQGATFRRLPGAGGNLRRSAAFSTPDEGWLEGPVQVTRRPVASALRPWPVAVRAPFTAVSHQPGAAGGDPNTQALAVGASGAVARYLPGTGWTREFLLTSTGAVTSPTLRGVAWPEPGRAYAVGDLGAMWLWRSETGLWERDPAAPVGFEANLMGVAFQPGSGARGYAVGRQGTLLRYDKTWTQEALPADVATRDITSVTFAGAQAIAVAGRDVLVSDGGPWRVDEQLRELLRGLKGADPQLLVAAGLPDGGAVVAGRNLVLQRDGAGRPWRFADQPLPGVTAVAAAAVRDGDRVRAVLSVVPGIQYPPGETLPDVDPDLPPPVLTPIPLPGDGYVLREVPGGWRDEQRQAFSGSGADRPVKPDPVAAFDLSPAGTGWAVGGWSGELDSAGRGSSGRNATGRANRQRVQTAAILRLGDGAQEAPPAVGAAEIPLDQSTVTFAVAGHAQCERACADLAGQDLAPDRALRTTVARVAQLATRPNGPRALLFTGGRTKPGGEPQSRAEADRYAELLGVGGGLPVFPAVSAGDVPDGSASTFRGAFAGAGAPLGTGAPGPTITPVSGPGPDGAATHYAFETTGPTGTVRVIVIDNAAGSLAASDPHQSPAEPQLPWLRDQLAAAKAKATPAIVVGSRDLTSRQQPALNVATDADEVARVLVDGGASAYFYERPEENRVTRIPAGAATTIPAFGTGTLGYRSPLSNTSDGPDALFGDSGFLLAQVDTVNRDAATNRAPVGVRLIPVIDDLALQAIDGTLLRRSRPSLFQGLGRRPVAGDRWGDISGADGNPNPPGGDPYTAFPPAQCATAGCATRLTPEFAFASSAPDIADFVRQDPASTNLRKPFLGADDKVVTDAASGLICPFNAGTTNVTVSAGGLAFTQRVTVLAGSVQRPCGTRPLDPSRFPAATPAAVPPPAAAPAAAPANSPPPPVSPPPPPAPQQPPPTPAPAVKAVPPVQPLPPAAPPTEVPPARDLTRAQVPAPPPPPAGGFGRPIPPGGAVIRVLEEKREEEIAPESSQAFAAYDVDEGPSVPYGPFVFGIVLLAAFAGASVRPGLRRRNRRAEHAVAVARVEPDPLDPRTRHRRTR
ncbi:hypothetical protein [Paraconexibacter algicola]|uniref:Uncharacterized protein n=1 Tax=Paraconexibacter algicola TaxID=2133960 RepID=A0A2T4UN21_9ACTN|nr:hypothetical protein [Paraconexibacter algicola]PTL60633.1 hypothetical protein C7Y72_13820 [Paraconexibacter algicola]